MTSSRLMNITLTVAMATGLAAIAGCAGQGDVDRTQPDKVRKSIFFDATGQPKTFYFRQTFVNVPPTSAYAFEGTQGQLEKVKFKIDEKFLTAYRAYDFVPGAENAFTGGTNDMEEPLMVYSIKSHFDVKREYNPGTGEQTNVISENTTDRPWDQREYMRVDWSTDLTTPEPGSVEWDPMTGLFTTALVHDQSYVQETTMADPNFKDRPIMTDNYLEFLQNKTYTPDMQACLAYYPGVDEGGPWDCGSAVVGVRNSFVPVQPSSYEPLEYPDTYPLTDASGNQFNILPNGIPCTAQTFDLAEGQYSGSDCTPASVDGFKKFGYFRTIVQTYDRNYGTTEAGRKYYANRWNIWQDNDASGMPIKRADGSWAPYDQRVPKPITYYTNVEFPDETANPELWDTARQVVGDWSDAFQRTVAALQLSAGMKNQPIMADAILKKAKTLDPMVILKKNNCNVADVSAWLEANPTVEETVKKAIGVDHSSLDTTHLMQACAIAEASTESLPDDPAGTPVPMLKKFFWQRNGDLRYSFFYWVDRPEPTMPLGFGPSSADPQTGEIISASLYNYGAALDSYAQMSADAVELLNDQISVDDLLSGKTIADVLKETGSASKARTAQTLTPEARAMALSKLPPSQNGSPRLIPVPGGLPASKISLLKGTQAEQMLMTPDILAAKLPMTMPGQQLTADQFAQASPVNWLSPDQRQARQTAIQNLGMQGCVYLGEFADDAILGLALKLKQEKGQVLWKDLRARIFRGLADHEMGHTMGLRHNFSGSSDALNYADQFWSLHENNKLTDDQREQQQISEYRYSTVMDYGSRFNSDINGLGKYDYAAIRFGYGQLVDVMDQGAAVNPDTMQQETGMALQSDILFSDYTKLPHLVGGAANLTDYAVEPYSAITTKLVNNYTAAVQALSANKPPQAGFYITEERPYKFCSDEYIGNLDCKQWDWGANQQEIVNDTIDRFKNYFVFNAFKRGRLTWTIDNYLNRLLERYFIRYIEAFQFYYFYGPEFSGTDLGDDLLMASMNSLNALGEVLETPEPGEHCPTGTDPNVLSLPTTSTGATACLPGKQFMDIQIPDGKPYYINFSDDYYYRITRAGSLYEKLAALITLTSTQAHFYRVDTFADANQYAINFYSVFKDEMLKLLSGVIRDDPSSYGGYIPSTGPNAGNYQPAPVVDLARYGQANPPTPEYMQPGALRVATPVNKTIQYFAIGLALANLDTSWDSTLDISNYLAVSLKGSKEDFNYAPGTTILEYTHPQSGLTYRAPVVPSDATASVSINGGIASQTIQELIDITGQPGVPARMPSKFGADFDNNPLPDWYTAKQDLDNAKAAVAAYTGTDTNMQQTLQTNFDKANAIFQFVDQGLVAYRVDLLNDIRNFRAAFGY
ncbi:MAG TPA: zinc-dependent metalloprotease [Polyangia bacterium]|nr:zinc-dependent metalloprotease [Polyangia bacterium]